MNDALFDHFVSIDNLKLAFEFVRYEIEKSSLPLDPFWVPGVNGIEKLGDVFFRSLSKQLIEDKYKPDENYLFHQPKQNFGIRRLAMLTMVDRVVYQALLNPEVLGNQLESGRSELSYYPGISQSDDHYYLQSYKEGYKSFWKTQRAYFDNGNMNYRGEYDVHSFFDSIPHIRLLTQIKKDEIGTNRIRSLLLNLLTSWYPSGCGIPQGPDPSSVLANYYLRIIDSTYKELASEVGYVRYMDDMIIMARSNNDLMKSLEIMTESLDTLGLDLNSKSKSEFIQSCAFFDERGVEYPYMDNESFNEWTHAEDVKVKADEVIGKLFMGDVLNRPDVSILRYHLRSTNDSAFAKNIIQFFSELPPIADLIARYLQPYGSESWVKLAIESIFENTHLFRWQRFWLAKLILVEQAKDELSYSQFDFCKSRLWEIRSMAWLTKSMRDPEAIKPSELISLMKNSENVFELGLYVEASAYLLPDEAVDNYLRDMSNGKSLELQMLVSARMLNPTQIDDLAISGNLFSTTRLPLEDTIEVKRDQTNPIEKVLGVASGVSNPRSRYSFEIVTVGKEILMMGSILKGEVISAFRSNRSSSYYFVLKELLSRRSSLRPDIYEEYLKIEIEEKVNLSQQINYVKSRRNLSPLCEALIVYMLDERVDKGSTYIKFRSALTPDQFRILPDKVLREIDNLITLSTENRVK